MTLANNISTDFIDSIKKSYQGNKAVIDEFIDLASRPDGYGKISDTHITATAFVIDKAVEHALLLHHSKYNQWLAFGGHWNDSGFSQETISQGAIREMLEEGFNNKVISFEIGNDGNPLDLDIHQAGTHKHYDVAFLVEISKSEPYTLSNEAKQINWIKLEDISLNRNGLFNERLVRMADAALKLNHKDIPTLVKNKKSL